MEPAVLLHVAEKSKYKNISKYRYTYRYKYRYKCRYKDRYKCRYNYRYKYRYKNTDTNTDRLAQVAGNPPKLTLSRIYPQSAYVEIFASFTSKMP